MSDDPIPTGLAERVRRLADLFVTTDLMRIRIEREHEQIELGRRASQAPISAESYGELVQALEAAPVRLDAIKADLVGIFHFSRPLPNEGDLLDGDRELAFIEALGIRNPVRSLGAGRIASIKRSEGDPVEYGQVLFEIDRG